ncbi:MAG TPA: ROK family protein [Blastocatellia bacterium]|nr:ROK family protein [Blastocatellia bacterium]HMV86323.1 ROK family protein [Blastocatellia bacterium]HMX25964.1 ROK family protein [Blastocatellia bacterium]HMY74906.1 ROK family protein [Blastocatellia bacterium]HMZ22179.1 ROK family protein [Blastocatellia bacterium]
MQKTIGVMAAEHIAAGLVENNRLVGALTVFPSAGSKSDYLSEMRPDQIAEVIAQQIETARQGQEIAAVGLGFPGIIRNGVIEDSPNLIQTKGSNLSQMLADALSQRGLFAPVRIFNDTDAMAAGVAATKGQLDKLIRVWWLGNGTGFGRYPQTDGIWEGGHLVVTLDPKEKYCACGGIGHLEGITGYRGMRLRFLDLEPEEVFEEARQGDTRCVEFVKLWHRAIAAATANSIHLDGPGKFYVSGPSAQFVQPELLDLYLHEMVKMSPLQGSQVEVISTSDETAVIGAAVNAARSAVVPTAS